MGLEEKSAPAITDVWSAFAKRAKPLAVVKSQACACPPNDWTANFFPPTKNHPSR